MRIINNLKESCDFHNLNDGDVFMYNNIPYMRINKYDSANDIVAIDLRDGTTVLDNSVTHTKWKDMNVRLVEATMTLTNKGE